MAKKYNNLFTKGSLIKDRGLMQHEEIKHKIKILPILEAFIPPLREEEFLQLEENIIAEGCREALLIWDSPEGYILVDGHNRYNICKKNNISFKIILLQFESLEVVKEWMLDNQLGRRNLTSEQSSYLRGLRYELEKNKKGGYKQVESKGQNDPSTAQKLAQDFHVSEKTIKRDAVFTQGLEKIGSHNPKLKQDILSGKIKLNKSVIRDAAKLDNESFLGIESVKDGNQLTKFLKQENTVSSTNFAFDNTKTQIKVLLSRLKKGDEATYLQLLEEVQRLKKYIS